MATRHSVGAIDWKKAASRSSYSINFCPWYEEEYLALSALTQRGLGIKFLNFRAILLMVPNQGWIFTRVEMVLPIPAGKPR